MIKFIGIIVFIFLPLLITALIIGRRMEGHDEREDRDLAIREGVKALKLRVLNLERIRSYRRERRG
ncbi:MAG: hypothetical protein DRP60_05710 [Spirochaetes bacterium]|nr:MAG: hypothetical protein DRP60_05710 [Spirochaetota bacterium]